MDAVGLTEMSELIGRIYDCAIEPNRWPRTMAEICRATNCAAACIAMVDMVHSRHKFFQLWNIAPEWAARQEQYYSEQTLLFRHSRNIRAQSFDTPLVLSRDVPRHVYEGTRYYNEWVLAQGFQDSLGTVVLYEPSRIFIFATQRSAELGDASDRDIEVFSLLSPHIRRAVTISDVLGLKNLEIDALSTTLDELDAGVVIVGNNRNILHANAAARKMFVAGRPVRSVNERLAAADRRAEQQLSQALALAQGEEGEIGAAGIGVALGTTAEPAVAHVLPLAHGEVRPRLLPKAAAAAVFIARELSGRQSPDISGIAKNFGLTPAQERLLVHLANGASLAAACSALSISRTTGKTHLAHIFSKTGTSRQSALVALVNRLVPPLIGGGGRKS